MTTPTTTVEQRCREAVKKAWHITREALSETGAGSNLLTALTMQAYPEVLRELLRQNGAAQTQPTPSITPIASVPPVTPIPPTRTPTPTPTPEPAATPTGVMPPSPGAAIPLQAQVFQEFLNRLPAQLRPLLRIKDHTGTEIIVACSEQLAKPDFAAVCRSAEELKGKWVPADSNSGWHLPLKRAEKK